jgi:hypothetical protein
LSTSNRNTEEKIAGFGAGGIDVVDQIEMLQAGSSFRPPDHGGIRATNVKIQAISMCSKKLPDHKTGNYIDADQGIRADKQAIWQSLSGKLGVHGDWIRLAQTGYLQGK